MQDFFKRGQCFTSKLMIAASAAAVLTLASAGRAQNDTAPEFRARVAAARIHLKQTLGLPDSDELYQINEQAMAARPRLYFGKITLDEVRRRFNDPHFADVRTQSDIIYNRWKDKAVPDSVIGMTDTRDCGDVIAPLALRVLIETDPGKRDEQLQAVLRWTRAAQKWTPVGRSDLELAQTTIALATVYDWLPSILKPEDLAAVRQTLIDYVRELRSEEVGGISRWRWQSYVFNHNWIDHSAMMIAGIALWGDDAAPLKPGELKSWLDEAVQDFWVVDHAHPEDGGPLEGVSYQDYGLHYYTVAADHAERLLKLKYSFFSEHLHAMANRVFLTLPDNTGFMQYADGMTTWYNIAPWWNLLATRFNDDRMTLIAESCRKIGATVTAAKPSNNNRTGLSSWLALFYEDTARKPVDPSTLPTHFDFTDTGLYTARSGWNEGSNFFGVRCGYLGSKSAAARWGKDSGNGHLYPNQGAFSFYSGPDAVVPGRPYPEVKLTSDHPLVVFDGRGVDAGKTVGQVGGDDHWFYVRPAKPAQRPSEVIRVQHQAAYHEYLCDLGGVYFLSDERAPGKSFYPTYFRSLMYLPTGAVIVVDRVETEFERSATLRIPTEVLDLAVNGDAFTGTIKGKTVRIRDFSFVPVERSVEHKDVLASYGIKFPRGVAIMKANDVKSATFAVILDVNDVAAGVQVKPDARGYTVTGLPAGDVRVDWPVK